MFTKYQHIERLKTTAVDGILNGVCHIFPKIDGTNGSLFLDTGGTLCAGSRNRQLSLENDNAGFMQHIVSGDIDYRNYLDDNSEHTLFGEWLVPHTIRTYAPSSWREFYIFDVFDRATQKYLPYDQYAPALQKAGIPNIIAPLAVIRNPTMESLVELMNNNKVMIIQGVGEGIVIKNYDYVNKFGNTVFAKMVSNEFSGRERKYNAVDETSKEHAIVSDFCKETLIIKIYSKLRNEDINTDFDHKLISRLLETVWYDFITEELYNALKKYKNCTIDFKLLRSLVTAKVKQTLTEIF